MIFWCCSEAVGAQIVHSSPSIERTWKEDKKTEMKSYFKFGSKSEKSTEMSPLVGEDKGFHLFLLFLLPSYCAAFYILHHASFLCLLLSSYHSAAPHVAFFVKLLTLSSSTSFICSVPQNKGGECLLRYRGKKYNKSFGCAQRESSQNYDGYEFEAGNRTPF